MTRSTGKPKNVHLGIRVDADTKTELDRLAGIAQRDTSEYARMVLEDHIKVKKIGGK